jgi:hypothetical protein
MDSVRNGPGQDGVPLKVGDQDRQSVDRGRWCCGEGRTESTPIGGAPAGAPPCMRFRPSPTRVRTRQPGGPVIQPAQASLVLDHSLDTGCVTAAREVMRSTTAVRWRRAPGSELDSSQTYWSEAPSAPARGSRLSRLLADHRSWLSPRTEGIPPGQRPNGGPGRT